MGRKNIYLSDYVDQQLMDYIKLKYPGKNVVSLIVEEAIKDYLKARTPQAPVSP